MEALRHTLFFDIETAPVVPSFSKLSPAMQEHWQRKMRGFRNSNPESPDSASLFDDRAGIFSEFAKVVCISFGSFHDGDGHWRFRVKSLIGDDEKTLLNQFCEVVTRFSQYHKTDLHLCGHNIREFDIPFLCRRMVIHRMSLPRCLQIQGKKPWEVQHIEDTLELWRFGDHKNFTSLGLLAEVLEVPSPKDDIDGSMVGAVYWQDHDLERIARYCMKDVVTTARVFLRLKDIRDIPVEPVFVTDSGS
jgi:hypothetical protein